MFGKYLYCANVKIFRSGITPGLGPDTHPPAINIRGEAHVVLFYDILISIYVYKTYIISIYSATTLALVLELDN